MPSPDPHAAAAEFAADEPADPADRPPLVVFSSSRWAFVRQRPQHLFARLAAHFRIVFVEEPVCNPADPYLASSTPTPGVEVLTPHTRVRGAGFHDDQLPVLEALLADALADRGIESPLVWLSTPMALPLVADLDPRAVIYDCADGLASSRLPSCFAPRQHAQREAALLRRADLVLAGGPALLDALRARRANNAHLLANGVDAAHFAPARLPTHGLECAAAHALHEGMPRPRIGFAGVIDERLDPALLGAVADLRPDWQIVMVGPVVRIDPARLPQRPNIRWLGRQDYDLLPGLQSHWDVCILPLAADEATGRAQAPETLALLAGGQPLVCSAIPDVRDVPEFPGRLARVATDAPAFVAAIADALAEPAAAREARRLGACALVEASSWDAVAARVRMLIGALPAQAPARLAAPHSRESRPTFAETALQVLVAGTAAVAARRTASAAG